MYICLLEFWLSVVAEPVALEQTVFHEREAHILVCDCLYITMNNNNSAIDRVSTTTK